MSRAEAENILASHKSSRRASVINPLDNGESSPARENCNRIMRVTLIVLCLVLTLVALIMIAIGIFAPSWWMLDVTEYSQEWQFGLWLYCRRGGMTNEVGRQGIDLRQWICDVRRNYAVASNLPGSFGAGAGYMGSGSYQSALYEQNSFAETDHNEIPVLTCLSICFIFTFISLFALCCAYCNKFVPYCILVSNLIAMITSVVAVLIYFVTMQDVTARRFTSYNSVYLLTFGYASYCVIAGAILLIINFIASIPLVIFTFAWHREPRGHRVQTFNDPIDLDAGQDLLREEKPYQPVYAVEQDQNRNHYYGENNQQDRGYGSQHSLKLSEEKARSTSELRSAIRQPSTPSYQAEKVFVPVIREASPPPTYGQSPMDRNSSNVEYSYQQKTAYMQSSATYTSGATPTSNKPVYIGTYNQAVASEHKHGDMPIERWQYEHTRQESRY